MQEEVSKIVDKLNRLKTTFTPASPIDSSKFFSGRHEQIKKVVEAILVKGKHIILFGERGVGKTSLANIIDNYLQGPIDVIRVQCVTQDNFNAIWRKVLKRMTVANVKQKMGFSGEEEHEILNLEQDFPPKKEIKPDDILTTFQSYGSGDLIIIDEFDRISDKATKTLMADMLKAFSDNLPEITVMVVGVAKTVHELIGEHSSIERSLRQIPLPRMAESELREIITKGTSEFKMVVEESVTREIVKLSTGFPHITHLLSLYAFQNAITEGRDTIQDKDLRVARDTALDEMEASIKNDYLKATVTSKKKTLYPQVLLACAIVKEDESGFFRPKDLEEPLTTIRGKEMKVHQYFRHLTDLCDKKRGAILIKEGEPKRYRYQFRNPLMKPYVLIRAAKQGTLLLLPFL